MEKLTIIADITVKVDQVDFVAAELLKLLDITRAEKGCVDYNYAQDNKDPRHFIFYENWESRELWQAHMNAPHMKKYAAKTETSVEAWVLNEMTTLS